VLLIRCASASVALSASGPTSIPPAHCAPQAATCVASSRPPAAAAVAAAKSAAAACSGDAAASREDRNTNTSVWDAASPAPAAMLPRGAV
jgi:hypothetical protein